MHDPPSLLYIAGIPASGKSHFGKWLEANHGYLHIDAELPGRLDALGLHGVWDAALTRTDARLLVDAFRDKGRTIILNWGFPPAFLPFITSLRSAGFSLWWFDSDVSAARIAYCEVGRAPMSFEGQVAKITAAWPEIQHVFVPNIVRVLEADGSRIPPAEIFRIIRGNES